MFDVDLNKFIAQVSELANLHEALGSRHNCVEVGNQKLYLMRL